VAAFLFYLRFFTSQFAEMLIVTALFYLKNRLSQAKLNFSDRLKSTFAKIKPPIGFREPIDPNRVLPPEKHHKNKFSDVTEFILLLVLCCRVVIGVVSKSAR